MLKLVLLYQYIYNTFSKCLKHEKSFYLHLYILIRPPRLLKNRAHLLILDTFVGPLPLHATHPTVRISHLLSTEE